MADVQAFIAQENNIKNELIATAIIIEKGHNVGGVRARIIANHVTPCRCVLAPV